eukprot:663352-Hanusia_phi.AAC.1
MSKISKQERESSQQVERRNERMVITSQPDMCCPVRIKVASDEARHYSIWRLTSSPAHAPPDHLPEIV